MFWVRQPEPDYLAKRLDSSDTMGIAQYQAMTVKLNLRGMTDLISLTFCSQQATVITDFSDLEAVGREHYMSVRWSFQRSGQCPADGYEHSAGISAVRLFTAVPVRLYELCESLQSTFSAGLTG